MHASTLWVLIGFGAAALVGCGGASKKNPHESGDGGAGGDPTATGNSGSAQGGSGSDAVAQGGGSGTTSGGGASSTSTTGEANAGAAGAPAIDGSGGDGTGGVSSGGATTMSGTGGTDLVDPPPNCESVRQSEDADSCSYEYTCDGRTHFDSCRRESDGAWACECGTFSTAKRRFEIEGVTGVEACRVIAEVCEGEYPLSPTETCRAKESTADEETCSARVTCGHAIDLGPGIVARAVENIRAKCEPTQNQVLMGSGFDCRCSRDSSGDERYFLTAPAAGDICEPLVSFCRAEEAPVFSEEICSYGEPAGIVEWTCPADPTCQGCALSHECRGLAPIAPDVAILDLSTSGEQRQYIVCRPQEGELHCACQEDIGEGVYGDETVPSEVRDVCRESRELCPR